MLQFLFINIGRISKGRLNHTPCIFLAFHISPNISPWGWAGKSRDNTFLIFLHLCTGRGIGGICLEIMAALLPLTFKGMPISNVKKGTLHTPTLNGQVLKIPGTAGALGPPWIPHNKAGFYQNQFYVNITAGWTLCPNQRVTCQDLAIERKFTSPKFQHQLNKNFPIDPKPAATKKSP